MREVMKKVRKYKFFQAISGIDNALLLRGIHAYKIINQRNNFFELFY